MRDASMYTWGVYVSVSYMCQKNLFLTYFGKHFLLLLLLYNMPFTIPTV